MNNLKRLQGLKVLPKQEKKLKAQVKKLQITNKQLNNYIKSIPKLDEYIQLYSIVMDLAENTDWVIKSVSSVLKDVKKELKQNIKESYGEE